MLKTQKTGDRNQQLVLMVQDNPLHASDFPLSHLIARTLPEALCTLIRLDSGFRILAPDLWALCVLD